MSKKRSPQGNPTRRAEREAEFQQPASSSDVEKPNKAVLPEDEVHLKSFMGVRPGHYLAWLYGAILLLVLFFILLYPGIKNPGSMVAVKSEPRGAAVSVDGVYMEAAPCEVFVSRGHHRIELSLPGFLSKNIEKDIGGRLFASALFPLKTAIEEKLEAQDPAGAFNDYAAEYAAWTFAGEPSAAYQIPLSLSEGAYRLGPGAKDPGARKSMEDTIAASARFAVTRAGIRDIIRAKSLVDNQGLSPSPVSLLGSVTDIISFLDENPESALWLGAALNGEAQSALAGSSWYTEASGGAKASGGKPSPEQQDKAPERDTFIQAGLLRFRMVSGGPLSGKETKAENFPAGTRVDTFYICDTVISAPAWERFLDQQPKWKGENTEALIKEGLVKEGYLNSDSFPGAPTEGVSGISWYAAKAFCEWLSASLPSQTDTPMEVRLPTEAEWEYAAKSGLFDYGHFWEWCEDSFAPLSFLSVPSAAAGALGSPERSLRGGAWVNTGGTVGPETRASLPPSFCSAFVSFRPVIAPKRN